MTNKLSYYDIMGVVVPGILLVCWLGVCFPGLASLVWSPDFSEAFAFVGAVALAVFVGQIMQAIGSLIEPFLYWTWGGKPTERAFKKGLGRYMSLQTTQRIRAKLVKSVGEDATNNDLFMRAMQLSDAAEVGRASRFNALYCYQRSLVTLLAASIIVAVLSLGPGALEHWPIWAIGLLLLALVSLLILVWHRAKQRGNYYVREVLYTAENELEKRNVERRTY